jgi:hypothetical protein
MISFLFFSPAIIARNNPNKELEVTAPEIGSEEYNLIQLDLNTDPFLNLIAFNSGMMTLKRFQILLILINRSFTVSFEFLCSHDSMLSFVFYASTILASKATSTEPSFDPDATLTEEDVENIPGILEDIANEGKPEDINDKDVFADWNYMPADFNYEEEISNIQPEIDEDEHYYPELDDVPLDLTEEDNQESKNLQSVSAH